VYWRRSFERITGDDYQQADENAEILDFNRRLKELTPTLSYGEGEFESIYILTALMTT
jgi:phosphopantetheine adenylyltransferase